VFETCTGQSHYYAVTEAVAIPAGLLRTQTYAATAPSNNAQFLVNQIKLSGGMLAIGTITLTANTVSVATLQAPSLVRLSLGDVVMVTAPTSDAANVAITIRAIM
jgi:hypothetical protein